MKKEIEKKAHARFSASGSERWLNCPGSIRACDGLPEQPPGPYALEGTEAHSVLEKLLRAYIDGERPYTLSRDLETAHGKDKVAHALSAFKWIEARHAQAKGAKVLCETKVELPVSEAGQFGTVDAAIVEVFGRLVVFDYKYGQGVLVSPRENSQLIYYALGLASLYDFNFESIELVIFQPRAADSDGETVRVHEMTPDELASWREKFESGIKAAKSKRPPFAAGAWCRWCPAAPHCPELGAKSLKQARIEFDSVGKNAKPPTAELLPKLTAAEIGNILQAGERVEEWLSRVREHAVSILNRGGEIPGWKMVQKRSTRKWSDVDAATKKAKRLFGSQVFSEPELLSPAQFEKAMKGSVAAGEFVTANASSISSGTTLVAMDDARPAVNLLANEFGKLE
jgi:hypothetical protein